MTKNNLRTTIIATNINSSYQLASDIAKNAQKKRLSFNLSQRTLSLRSGVSLGSIKKFERTGQISLESLLKIALVLDELSTFAELFTKKEGELPQSLDELLVEEKTRKRGRK